MREQHCFEIKRLYHSLRRSSRTPKRTKPMTSRFATVFLCVYNDKGLKIIFRQRTGLRCILSNDAFAARLPRRLLVFLLFSPSPFSLRELEVPRTARWHGQRKLERTSRKAKGAHVYTWLPAFVWDNVSLNRKGTCAACTCCPGRST